MPPKYITIAADLRNKIASGSFSELDVLPTESAICQKYQVSRQTARQALSVLVKEGLIERRQGSGSRILKNAKTAGDSRRTTVAVVTTYISDYIFPSILREAEKVFSENNCTPLLFSTQNQVDNERKILTDLLAVPVDGILVEGSKSALPNPNLDLYRKFISSDVPLVFMHSNYASLARVPTVLDDNAAGGRMLVEYLYAKGHRRIAGVFKSDDIQGLLRYEGYTAALRDLGLSISDKNVFWYDTAMKKRLLKNGEGLDRAFQAISGCSAVVCYNDEIANHLESDLIRRGVKIPEELAIVSFDNSHYSEFAAIRITSLSHGKQNVGNLSAELLLRLMHGEEGTSVTVPWTLVEKESS